MSDIHLSIYADLIISGENPTGMEFMLQSIPAQYLASVIVRWKTECNYLQRLAMLSLRRDYSWCLCNSKGNILHQHFTEATLHHIAI